MDKTLISVHIYLDMNKKSAQAWEMRSLGYAALIALMLTLMLPLYPTSYAREGTIVVSFPYLSEIVKKISGDEWEVSPLVPPGVDPHDYALSVKDIDKLRASDVIVITNHTSFERRIIELVESGTIRPGRLIVAEEIEGMRFLVNPDTDAHNPHVICYDPDNLLRLAKEVKEALTALDPPRSDLYNSRYVNLTEQVLSLKQKYDNYLNVKAVASTPLVQYAVHWVGVDIRAFLIPEHDVQLSPVKIREVYGLIDRGEVEAVVVRAQYLNGRWEPATQYDELLSKIATERGLLVISVPDPMSGNFDIVTNLQLIADSLSQVRGEGAVSDFENSGAKYALMSLVGVVVIIIALTAKGVYKRW